jgi:hypothetical protein
MLPLRSFVAVTALAVVHLLAGRMRFLDVIPRSGFLSFAGGMSVAYVFVRLLPELHESQAVLVEAGGEALEFLRHHVYLVALLGFTVFYGLERAAEASRMQQRRDEAVDRTSSGVFWLHIVSFAFFNALIGYLMIQWERLGFGRMVLFFAAMALHFLVNDYGLRQHHQELYHRRGRWVLAATVYVGWALGVTVQISEAMVALPLAFVAGGVMLNVLKEELPKERESRFSAFALGVVLYSVLLLAL